MKKLMYLSISMLCIAITLLIGFHIGSQSVKAQAPTEAIVGHSWHSGASVVLSNGDVYFRRASDIPSWHFNRELEYVGNIWEGGVPASSESWGGIKGKYEER